MAFFVREKELAPLAPAHKLLDATPPVPHLSLDLVPFGLIGSVVDDVLSTTECTRITKACTATGFSFWDPEGRSEANMYLRTGDTLEFDGKDLCEEVWRRLAPFLPPAVEIREPSDERWEHELEGRWEATGLNPHLLVNKYGPGGHFAPHADGCTQVRARPGPALAAVARPEPAPRPPAHR